MSDDNNPEPKTYGAAMAALRASQRVLREVMGEASAARIALHDLMTDPHGCPMCDWGKLRPSAVTAGKGHWPDCRWEKARAVLGEGAP